MEGLTVGRIVHYVLTEADQKAIASRRQMTAVQRGNYMSVGSHLPMIVVAVWPHEFGDTPGVNGQVFLDGDDSLWVTSIKYDEMQSGGTWHWIEKA